MSEHGPTEATQETFVPDEKIFPTATDAEHEAWEEHKKKVETEKKENEEKIQKRRKELSEPQSDEATFMVSSVRDTIREAEERLVKLKKYAEDEKKRYEDVKHDKENEYAVAKEALRVAKQQEAAADVHNIQSAVAIRVHAEEAEKTAKEVLATVEKHVSKSTGHLERIQKTEKLIEAFKPRLTDSTDRSTAFNIGENVLILMDSIETHPEKQGGHGEDHGHGEEKKGFWKSLAGYTVHAPWVGVGAFFGGISWYLGIVWGEVTGWKGGGGGKKSGGGGHGGGGHGGGGHH
ncbi:MAG: hypothetical protein WC761_06320 [Candidatus Paceibacterota bacterium]|jgi:hypothetical protein